VPGSVRPPIIAGGRVPPRIQPGALVPPVIHWYPAPGAHGQRPPRRSLPLRLVHLGR
jgi:hypothetical protein